MVKFGKFLKSMQHSKWVLHYFNYKLVKDSLRPEDGNPRSVARKFCYHMDQEIDKVTEFVWTAAIELKTTLAGLSAQLPAQVETLVGGSEAGCAREYLKRVLAVAKEARELTLFLDVNLVAVHKILKKLNKKTGSAWAHEYVQSKALTETARLWDFSLLNSIQRDLETVAEKTLAKAAGPSGLQEPLLNEQEALREDSEAVQGLVEQMKGTLRKLETNMPLGRYMKVAVTSTGIFQGESAVVSAHMWTCALVLGLYWVNSYLAYGSCRSFAEQYEYPATLLPALLSLTPLSAGVMALFHGSALTLDFKLPLVYSVVLCAIGNALYGVATEAHALWFILAGRIFLGLGDPTLLLVLHFSSSLHMRLRAHWELLLLLLFTGSQGASWLLQASVASVTPQSEYLSQAFVGLWLLVLVPVSSFFDSGSAYRHSLMQSDSRRRDSALWLLLCLFVPAAMYEASLVTIVTVVDPSWVPMQFLLVCVSGIGGLMLYAHKTLRNAKVVLAASQVLGVVGSLALMLQDDQPEAWTLPLCVAFFLLPLGLLVTVGAMRQLAWGTGRLIQTAYVSFLSARVLSGWSVSALATWNLEFLPRHVAWGLLAASLLFGLSISAKTFSSKAS